MSYKILFKRYSDKKIFTFFESEENTKKFLIDLREFSFWVLHGKMVKWGAEDIEHLQILDINYDYYDSKRGHVFHVWFFNGDIWPEHEYMSAFELDRDFYPMEHDITRELIINYYRTNKYKLEEIITIKEVTYNREERKLFFDNKPFDLSSSSSYISIARMFFENWWEEIWLWEITDDFVWGTDDLEKHTKNVRWYIHHFNSIIEKEFNIPELIRVEEKALHNTFPVILINSESD